MNNSIVYVRLLIGALLVSSALCVPVTEQKQKVTKRDIGSMGRGGENMAVDDYRGEILPGMVDDQVAEAFLKNAAREDARQERRKEQEDEEEEDEGPIEVPLALPMAHVVNDDDAMEYAEEKVAPHRSKALAEDIYPSED
ncbi:uncharacterized protein LOC122376658, partial [Amphibalanus amphitrite]|uniref:uncharacterized protein LOC122376658 n=1 Tax=Amphibalanus amphitrite TaxID=1232801 RepID=UPI001C92134D